MWFIAAALFYTLCLERSVLATEWDISLLQSLVRVLHTHYLTGLRGRVGRVMMMEVIYKNNTTTAAKSQESYAIIGNIIYIFYQITAK